MNNLHSLTTGLRVKSGHVNGVNNSSTQQ